MIHRLLPVSLLVLASLAPSAELVVRDIGVGLELPPTGFDFSVSDDNGSRSGSDSFEHALGVEVAGRWSFARIGDSNGAVLGLGLAADRASYPTGGTWTSTEVRGTAGWGWAPTDHLTVLAEGLLGLGVARLRIDGNGAFGDYTADGAIIDPGVQAVALWSFTERWIGWGSLGYRYGRAKLTGDGTDVDLTVSGFAVGVGLAWRITDRPFLLE